jgi:hypothetical protein
LRTSAWRWALALAVGAAESRICFSYPRLDPQAEPRPRAPSFYGLEALRATEGRLPDFSELARHLITANPYLARALRARYQRWGRSWTASDGLVSRSEPALAVMARHTLGMPSYSPTALQNLRVVIRSAHPIHGTACRPAIGRWLCRSRMRDAASRIH